MHREQHPGRGSQQPLLGHWPAEWCRYKARSLARKFKRDSSSTYAAATATTCCLFRFFSCSNPLTTTSFQRKSNGQHSLAPAATGLLLLDQQHQQQPHQLTLLAARCCCSWWILFARIEWKNSRNGFPPFNLFLIFLFCNTPDELHWGQRWLLPAHRVEDKLTAKRKIAEHFASRSSPHNFFPFLTVNGETI